jgi:hypothetical protein
MEMRPPLFTSPHPLDPLIKDDRWVGWKWERSKTSTPTKPPRQGRAPKKYASNDKPETWTDFQTCMIGYCEHKFDGVGWALTGNEEDIGALDVDNCRDKATGKLHPWAEDLIKRCPNTYVEVTPSGEGVRIIGIANGPALHCKLQVPGAKMDGLDKGVSCEIYRQATRYITVTGLQIGNATGLADINGVIDAVYSELNASKDNDDDEQDTGQANTGTKRSLEDVIRDGCGTDWKGDRSRAVWWVIHELLRKQVDPADIVETIFDRKNRISEHVHAQVRAREYARKQVEKAQREAEKNTAKAGQKAGGCQQSAKDVLVELANEAELFHTRDGTAFADFVVNGHRETWSVRTKGYRRWLGRRYYEMTGSAPNSEGMQAAINLIDAKAHYDWPLRDIAVRVAGMDGRIYIDLCNDDWQAVEIDEDGWRIIDEPPARFRRAAGMLPLPTPERGGSIKTLRKYLNLTTADPDVADTKFVLAVSVLVAYLRPQGPYPVLALAGEQGAAKSTFCCCAAFAR